MLCVFATGHIGQNKATKLGSDVLVRFLTTSHPRLLNNLIFNDFSAALRSREEFRLLPRLRRLMLFFFFSVMFSKRRSQEWKRSFRKILQNRCEIIKLLLRSAWQAWQEIQVVHGNLKPEEARSSDEVFATSTAGGIIPITRIDGQIINSGLIGPVTQKLQDGYWMLHNETKYSSVINY